MKSLRPLLFFVSLLLIVGLAGGCRSAQQPDSAGPKAIVEEPTATPPPDRNGSASNKEAKRKRSLQKSSIILSPGIGHQFLFYDEKVSDPEAVTVKTENGKLVWNFDTKES